MRFSYINVVIISNIFLDGYKIDLSFVVALIKTLLLWKISLTNINVINSICPQKFFFKPGSWSLIYLYIINYYLLDVIRLVCYMCVCNIYTYIFNESKFVPNFKSWGLELLKLEGWLYCLMTATTLLLNWIRVSEIWWRYHIHIIYKWISLICINDVYNMVLHLY